MTITVRSATLDDVEYIASVCGEEMVGLLGYAKWYDREAMEAYVASLVGMDAIAVAVEGDTILGAIGAVETTMPWNPEVRVLAEVFWWVLKEARVGRVGKLLLEVFEQHAKNIGVTAMSMSVLPTTNASLEKRGYRVAEHSLVKEM